jgi:hypothetical protein
MTSLYGNAFHCGYPEIAGTAVEKLLEGIEKERLDAELAAAYVANNERNLELLKEFAHVDREGF